ncbi:MAG TPA: tetratricopeptide repeat protein [Gammaproteobacteria bacterium]|nr:tetratricopeptide repeat protein [Gammaproteobacteria bacterium]
MAASLEGAFLHRAQRFEEALPRLEEARRMNANFWLIRVDLAETYAGLGRMEEALAEARVARSISNDSTWAIASEITQLAHSNQRAQARALLEQLLHRATERYVPPYDIAVASIGLDDAEGAILWLRRAYEARDPKTAFLGITANTTWRSIQGRPEFADLLTRMNYGAHLELNLSSQG